MNSKNGENIVKLNNSNYFNWKYRMELLLTKEDLWEILIEEIPTGTIAFNRWNKKDKKARALIGLAVEDSQLVYIRNQQTARDTWKVLREAHEKDTIVNKVSLYKKISFKRAIAGDDIEKHINELSDLFQQLSDLSETISEAWKVGMLLGSLPDNFHALVTALEVRPEKDLTWMLVQSKILDEYFRQRNMTEDKIIEEKVLKITTKNQSKIYCYFCKRDNHKMADCVRLKQYKEFEEYKQNKKIAENKEKVNFLHAENDVEFIFMVGQEEESKEWILDSGSTVHICCDRKKFNFIQTLKHQQQIRLPNGTLITAKESGSCHIKTKDDNGKERKITITDVLYVPEIKTNVISISRLMNKGFAVSFTSKGNVYIKFDNKTVATAILQARLFKLLTEESPNSQIQDFDEHSSNEIEETTSIIHENEDQNFTLIPKKEENELDAEANCYSGFKEDEHDEYFNAEEML